MARKDVNPYRMNEPGHKALVLLRRGFYLYVLLIAIAVAVTYHYWG